MNLCILLIIISHAVCKYMVKATYEPQVNDSIYTKDGKMCGIPLGVIFQKFHWRDGKNNIGQGQGQKRGRSYSPCFSYTTNIPLLLYSCYYSLSKDQLLGKHKTTVIEGM